MKTIGPTKEITTQVSSCMRWRFGLNASASEILGNNYKDFETNFDVKVVKIPFQRQTTQLDRREILKQTITI